MAKTATWRNTPYAHKFYHSKAWLNVRSVVWDRAHGLCERCLERGEVRPANVVHHIVPLSPANMGDASVTLNVDNLVALCHDCHTVIHKQLGVGALNGELADDSPRVTFDSEGNVVRIGS